MQNVFGGLKTSWAPYKVRRQIPFYYDKTEVEFRADPYENYTQSVVRQSLLHLADEVWGYYPMQKIEDWIIRHLPQKSKLKITEIGCGVGRMIGDIAQKYADSQCYGLDFSYQMLRQARDYWIQGKPLELDLATRGFSTVKLSGKKLSNLDFALAKAEKLPFENGVLDVIYSSFLIDRVDAPKRVLSEMCRVLKKGGVMILATPFNFQKRAHWTEFHPVEKFEKIAQAVGFKLIAKEESLCVREYLDQRKNHVEWKVVLFFFQKN